MIPPSGTADMDEESGAIACAFTTMCFSFRMNQWCSKGQAWWGSYPAKVRPAHVRKSASVVSAMVKRTAGAWPMPCNEYAMPLE